MNTISSRDIKTGMLQLAVTKFSRMAMMALLTFITSVSVFADEFTADGIKYTITSADAKTVGVSRNGYSDDVVIPSTVAYDGNTYTVTSIEWWAFSSCTSLTSVSLPSTITKIGTSAFVNCSNLSNIALPASLKEINQFAFSGCEAFTDIVIPEGVTYIGTSAFQSCLKLAHVSFPSTLTTMETAAFSSTGLVSVDIPASLETIPQQAFAQCDSLTTVTLHEGLKTIGEMAFWGDANIVEMRFPKSLEKIEANMARTGDGPETVYCPWPRPITIGDDALACALSLHIPKGTLAHYSAAKYWSEYYRGGGFYVEDETLGTYSDLTVADCEHGTISMEGSSGTEADRYVSADSTLTLIFTPEDGYMLDKVAVNGTDLTVQVENNRLTLSGITEASSIEATFAPSPTVRLTIRQADNGTVTVQVPRGMAQSLKITPDEGWTINSVTINGEDVTDDVTSDGELTTLSLSYQTTLNIAYAQVASSISRPGEQAAMKVYAAEGSLTVRGVPQGKSICVYDTAGMLLKKVTSKGDNTRIPVPGGKVYLVKTAGMTVKIAM